MGKNKYTVPKEWFVVRKCGESGVSFDNEEVMDGRVIGWSVYVGETADKAKQLAFAHHSAHHYYASTKVENIYHIGGSFLIDDDEENKGHCLVTGAKVDGLKNCFSNVQEE
ncbi:MAG: hypothetical protein K0Q49_2449 [Haloplasmataceae bacterium]|jgi:hypothetical protein|nr:hypothetical protein [Haloplasmataceae bacterium]